MSKKVYALLVGINEYSPAVGRLSGCVNDVDNFHEYLNNSFDPHMLHVKVLKDTEATRTNIIDGFRSHLCNASADDIVVFHYCGHGARSKSANEFEQFYPDGKDEGLVCYDSRNKGGFDLADKELAVLLAEVAKSNPHIAVVLDCCHSGSATRSADDFTQLKARQTHEVLDERPLETYLDGYYSALLERDQSLQVPASRHILLAACQRFQKAWESKDHSGVFTSTLLEVLRQSGTNISYADLFMRCRATVRKRADNQEPQFETYGGFNAYDGFIGHQATGAARRYNVYYENNAWQVDCGALHGLPTDTTKKVELVLYTELDRAHPVGHATTIQVGAQKSQLQLLEDMVTDTSTKYQAEITSLPFPPLSVYLEGNARGTKTLQEFLATSEEHSPGIALLTDAQEGAGYALSADNDRYILKLRESGKLIQGANGYTEKSADYMFSILKRIATWERAVALQNQATRMKPDDVLFKFCEVLENKKELDYTGGEITIDIGKKNNEWKILSGMLKAKNLSQQRLHLVLVYFSEDYGIRPLYNEPVEPNGKEFTLALNDGDPVFNLSLDEDEGDEAVHTFKLIVSTEKVDDFLLGQEPLKLGDIITPGATRGFNFKHEVKKLAHENEWFTLDLHIKLVRQLDRVSGKDTALADGKITIKGHPSLQAGISLIAAASATRGVGADSYIHRVLQRQGMEMLNFSGTRGDNESILELTEIQDAESLEQNPLEIELDIDLDQDEFILPLAFDGEHILMIGDPSCDNEGRTHISINHVPDIPDNRRSFGKALKLYFFKTWLRRENVNQLCWIEYGNNGSAKRHADGIAEKVAAAGNVLLLIHGIIGDTQGIAEGLPNAMDAAGTRLDEKFDLILTFDYENLNTPIAETAIQLKTQLRDIGLHENNDKRLSLLAHSMGGLVARWFIEKEGGNKVVDHLVMCGTPNVGSPFGMIGGARKLSSALTTLAINSYPVFAPFGGAMLFVLNRSQKITQCLEQMAPGSEFIKTLNASDDPGVRYTIVAGDTREYQEENNGTAAKLIAKIGRGVLFDTLYKDAAHDIAVSVDSIRGVTEARMPVPVKQNVAGHHLNYFVNEASLRTLAAIEW